MSTATYVVPPTVTLAEFRAKRLTWLCAALCPAILQGFLTCVFSKSAEIFISHPHDGSRRTAKELFLNYGIFLFMYSWVSFLNVIIGFWIAALSLIKILDRRIFYYRYFFSDEVLVSALLILGFFITVRDRVVDSYSGCKLMLGALCC